MTFIVAGSSFIVYELTALSLDSAGSSDIIHRGALKVLLASLPILLVLGIITLVRHVRTRNVY